MAGSSPAMEKKVKPAGFMPAGFLLGVVDPATSTY
jgi:hypothetical protein